MGKRNCKAASRHWFTYRLLEMIITTSMASMTYFLANLFLQLDQIVFYMDVS